MKSYLCYQPEDASNKIKGGEALNSYSLDCVSHISRRYLCVETRTRE